MSARSNPEERAWLSAQGDMLKIERSVVKQIGCDKQKYEHHKKILEDSRKKFEKLSESFGVDLDESQKLMRSTALVAGVKFTKEK